MCLWLEKKRLASKVSGGSSRVNVLNNQVSSKTGLLITERNESDGKNNSKGFE